MTDLVVTMHEGGSADEVKITVDDRDFAVTPPRKGAVLSVMMGYQETGLALMGTFTVRGRKRHFNKGGGAVLEITGKSADFARSAKKPRTEHHEKTTLGDLLKKVSGRNGWGLKVSGTFASLKVDYEAQSEESDIHLATRLARELDALCQIGNGKLLFLDRDELTSALTLTRTDFIDCSVSDDDRAAHSKSTAHWHDRANHKRVPESIDMHPDGVDDAPEFQQRHTHLDQARAKAAAKGKASEMDRKEKHLTGTLTGNTAIVAGLIATVAIGAELYDGEYGLKTVTHHMKKGGGYTTKIDSHKGKAKKGGKSK
jgi:phage protein D